MPFLPYLWVTATMVAQAQLSSLPMQTLSAAKTAHSLITQSAAVASVCVHMCNVQTALHADAHYTCQNRTIHNTLCLLQNEAADLLKCAMTCKLSRLRTLDMEDSREPLNMEPPN